MKNPVHMLGVSAGQPGAGKDTLFDLLKSHYGDLVVNVKFADALTEYTRDQMAGLAHAEFPFIRNDSAAKDHDLYMFRIEVLMPGPYKSFLLSQGFDPTEKRSARWHLLWFGTKFMREHCGREDYWLTAGFQAAKRVYDQGKVPIITDVRFPNELTKLHTTGGTSVYVLNGWSTKDGGFADGLIKPMDCDASVTNHLGEPKSMLNEFLTSFELKGSK